MEQSLTNKQTELKEKFIEERGYWAPIWNGLLELDPEFLEKYLSFSAVPWKQGYLEPKIKELIYVAIDVSTTHLYEPGIRVHMQNALRYGATKEEIMEVLELTSVLGIHTCTVSIPILLAELEANKKPVSEKLNDRQVQLKEQFIRERGYWAEIWDGLLRLNPDFLETYLAFSAVPWKHGPLEPKVKELIYVAIDVATTHLYEPGIKVHMQNALRYGATKEEIMEVLELTSVLGIHTCTVGVDVLLDELSKQ